MVKTILFGLLITFLIVGLGWILVNIFSYVRYLYLIHKIERNLKNFPVTTMCYGSMRISEDNVYQFCKTRLLTDMVLAQNQEFEKFIKTCREGHDLSVLFESYVSNLAETDAEIKKQYEEFKASSDYIPPEERLFRPRFHLDEQRPSLSEDKP